MFSKKPFNEAARKMVIERDYASDGHRVEQFRRQGYARHPQFLADCPLFAGGSGAGCSICQICRQEDHLTNDCPDAHSGYQECEHCGQVDHATENCPHHAHLDDGSDGGAA
uniref:CCHC-type domain-containing protein n=1 Tax=Ditylenchus dipsaci TaxID=166011 RepID=A0A915EQ41_9BILA